jgi:hypothetical protein
MATVQEHRLKAVRNRDFLDSHKLSEGEFVDWGVTVLFYCALHWVRALLAQERYQVKNCRDEEDAITGTRVFTLQALEWYRHLKDSSRQARYETKEFSPSAYRDLRQSCFEPFKTFITSKLRA